MGHPYRLAQLTPQGEFLGIIPRLRTTSRHQMEVIADSYRRAYPGSLFDPVKVDERGYRVVDDAS